MVEAASRGLTPTVLIANPSADLYGSDRMMLESVRGLVAQGWRVVVTCSEGGPLVAPLKEAGAAVSIMPVPVIRKASLNPRGMIILAGQVLRGLVTMSEMIGRTRPDVVMVNTVTIPFWLVAARIKRVSSVVYVHEAESSLSRAARFALKAPLALATRVVFNSKTSRRVSSLKVVERAGRSRVVPNGVQGPPQTVPARRELTAPFRVVYIGRLSPRKGVDVVVRAAAALVEQGIPVHLDVVGAVFPGYEWYEAELRDLVADLRISEHVRFCGFHRSIWTFLADADVATVPSRLDESFGNAVIEALLAGRPVVVSDHTGLREAAAGFAAAVPAPADDVAAWTAALRQVHDGWAGYRAAAIVDAPSARERFGTERFHQQMTGVLAEACQRSARRDSEPTSPR